MEGNVHWSLPRATETSVIICKHLPGMFSLKLSSALLGEGCQSRPISSCLGPFPPGNGGRAGTRDGSQIGGLTSGAATMCGGLGSGGRRQKSSAFPHTGWLRPSLRQGPITFSVVPPRSLGLLWMLSSTGFKPLDTVSPPQVLPGGPPLLRRPSSAGLPPQPAAVPNVGTAAKNTVPPPLFRADGAAFSFNFSRTRRPKRRNI